MLFLKNIIIHEHHNKNYKKSLTNLSCILSNFYLSVNDSEFNWKQACIVREESHKTWSGYPGTADTYIFREGLYASVDSVHLMKVCIICHS